MKKDMTNDMMNGMPMTDSEALRQKHIERGRRLLEMFNKMNQDGDAVELWGVRIDRPAMERARLLWREEMEQVDVIYEETCRAYHGPRMDFRELARFVERNITGNVDDINEVGRHLMGFAGRYDECIELGVDEDELIAIRDSEGRDVNEFGYFEDID